MGRVSRFIRGLFIKDQTVQDLKNELQQLRCKINEMNAELTLLRELCEYQQQHQPLPPARIPDVERYDGSAATFSQFETNLLAKMAVDGRVIGSEHEWVIYSFNRLEPKAAEKMAPWIRERLETRQRLCWRDFLKELCWTFDRERILQQVAFERLHAIEQGDRSVREYIWEFTETLRSSGEQGKRLSEAMKMQLLLRGLNHDICAMFRGTDYAGAKSFEDFCGTVYLTALTKEKASLAKRARSSST